jgi:2,3-bisphosphoglycerate-independent phosphoglycerate mutase
LLETEKYPHVTFFLSGEENCLLLWKPHFKTTLAYVRICKPQMSAFELTEALIPELNKEVK